MEKSFLFLLFAVFSTAELIDFARGRDGTRIRGGSDALAGEFPYQVSLEVGGQSFCGGGVVSEWFVVSAAHCFVSKNTFQFYPTKVVAGIHKLHSNHVSRQEVGVYAVYIPEDYFKKQRGNHPLADISVIRLKQPLKFNRYVTALKLPDPESTYTGKRATISGFGWNHVDLEVDKFTGRKAETGGRSDGKLRFAQTKVVDPRDCSRMYGNAVDGSLVCAQVVQRSHNSPEGVCSGDSGGPLAYNHYTLIGVVSTSPTGCIEDKLPGVYTRVSSYLNFIRRALNDQIDSTIRRYIMTIPQQQQHHLQVTTSTSTRAPVPIAAVKKSWRPGSFYLEFPSNRYNRRPWSINFL